MFSAEPITDLEAESKEVGSAFTTAHFLPHGKEIDALLMELKRDAARRAVQVAMEEDPTKMDKMKHKGITTPTIKDEHALISMSGNITAFVLALTTFDAASCEEGKVPFLHYVARKVGLAISSKEYRKYLDKSHSHAKLNYYVFNIIDRTFTTFFKVLEDEDSLQAASPDVTSKQPNAAHAIMANTCLVEGLKYIANVCANAEVPKDCAPYLAYLKSYKTSYTTPRASGSAKRLMNNDLEDRSETKRAKDEARRSAQKEVPRDNVGAIFCKAKGIMPMPKDHEWPAGEKPLCSGKLRNGTRGCGRPGQCSFNHQPPAGWSPTLLDFMKSWVEDHKKELSWNFNVASPEILGLQYNQSKKVEKE